MFVVFDPLLLSTFLCLIYFGTSSPAHAWYQLTTMAKFDPILSLDLSDNDVVELLVWLVVVIIYCEHHKVYLATK